MGTLTSHISCMDVQHGRGMLLTITLPLERHRHSLLLSQLPVMLLSCMLPPLIPIWNAVQGVGQMWVNCCQAHVAKPWQELQGPTQAGKSDVTAAGHPHDLLLLLVVVVLLSAASVPSLRLAAAPGVGLALTLLLLRVVVFLHLLLQQL